MLNLPLQVMLVCTLHATQCVYCICLLYTMTCLSADIPQYDVPDDIARFLKEKKPGVYVSKSSSELRKHAQRRCRIR